MKKLLLGIALASLVVACKNNDNNQVSDASSAEIPAACDSDCSEGSGCCSDAEKTDCSGTSGCSGESSGAVCPVTGKKIEG